MKKEIRTLVLYRLNRADESLEEAKKFISSIKNIIGWIKRTGYFLKKVNAKSSLSHFLFDKLSSYIIHYFYDFVGAQWIVPFLFYYISCTLGTMHRAPTANSRQGGTQVILSATLSYAKRWILTLFHTPFIVFSFFLYYILVSKRSTLPASFYSLFIFLFLL